MLWLESFYFCDQAKAEALLEASLARWPESPFFLYLGGYYLRENGHVKRAITLFEKVHDNSRQVQATPNSTKPQSNTHTHLEPLVQPQVRQMQLSAMYELGWCHYLLLDFEKCRCPSPACLLPHHGSYSTG